MLPFTYRYFPKRMNFAINPPSNKINKFSLTILSQKHAHCEPFSSLPFLLFNKYENGLESERESVQINSSGFRFNVAFVDCTSVLCSLNLSLGRRLVSPVYIVWMQIMGETAFRQPSVPFPWSVAVHHQSLTSTTRKTKPLGRRLSPLYLTIIPRARMASESMGAIHSTKIPTGPTGKRGPPQKVGPFFRNFSGWIEPIH